jgi:hypothetical protein
MIAVSDDYSSDDGSSDDCSEWWLQWSDDYSRY